MSVIIHHMVSKIHNGTSGWGSSYGSVPDKLYFKYNSDQSGFDASYKFENGYSAKFHSDKFGEITKLELHQLKLGFWKKRPEIADKLLTEKNSIEKLFSNIQHLDKKGNIVEVPDETNLLTSMLRLRNPDREGKKGYLSLDEFHNECMKNIQIEDKKKTEIRHQQKRTELLKELELSVGKESAAEYDEQGCGTNELKRILKKERIKNQNPQENNPVQVKAEVEKEVSSDQSFNSYALRKKSHEI